MDDFHKKPWLKSYPEGVASTIKFDEFNSLVDMFEKTCKRFPNNKAFTNFGVSLTFNEIYLKSINLAFFLQNNQNVIALSTINRYSCQRLSHNNLP